MALIAAFVIAEIIDRDNRATLAACLILNYSGPVAIVASDFCESVFSGIVFIAAESSCAIAGITRVGYIRHLSTSRAITRRCKRTLRALDLISLCPYHVKNQTYASYERKYLSPDNRIGQRFWQQVE